MEQTIKEIEVNGILYVPKDSLNEKTVVNTDGLEMVMIRTESAGVHYGYLKSKEYTLAGTIVVLLKARRVWAWYGAASLSQLATDGTSKPNDCKFPCEVNSIELKAIEIMPITNKALKSLNKVKIWEE